MTLKMAITAFPALAVAGQPCSEPALDQETERWMINHDATDGTRQAILKSADKGGLPIHN